MAAEGLFAASVGEMCLGPLPGKGEKGSVARVGRTSLWSFLSGYGRENPLENVGFRGLEEKAIPKARRFYGIGPAF